MEVETVGAVLEVRASVGAHVARGVAVDLGLGHGQCGSVNYRRGKKGVVKNADVSGLGRAARM
jgi:hypothetical protein